MADSDHQDETGEEFVYGYRPSLLGAPWEFRLAPTGIAWEVGRRSGLLPYGDIDSVRISFRPTTMQTQCFVTEIWPRSGAKLTISSASWKSMVEQQRQDAPYLRFVSEFHRRLVPAAGQTTFISGAAPYLYWPGFVVFAAALVGLAILLTRALQLGQWAAAAFIGAFFLLFIWQLGNYFRRNRPGRYRPDAVPEALLPRASPA